MIPAIYSQARELIETAYNQVRTYFSGYSPELAFEDLGRASEGALELGVCYDHGNRDNPKADKKRRQKGWVDQKSGKVNGGKRR